LKNLRRDIFGGGAMGGEITEGCKEVYYCDYCKTCSHKNEPEDSDTCNDCLNQPYNIDSHKPINYNK